MYDRFPRVQPKVSKLAPTITTFNYRHIHNVPRQKLMARRDKIERGLDVLIPKLCNLGEGVAVCCCGEVGTVGVIVVTTTATVVKVDVIPFDVTTDSNVDVELVVKGVDGVVGVTTLGVVVVVGGGVVEVVGGTKGGVELVDVVRVVEVVGVEEVDELEEVVGVVASELVDEVGVEDDVVDVVEVVEVVGVVGVVEVVVCVVVCDVVVLFDCRFAKATTFDAMSTSSFANASTAF